MVTQMETCARNVRLVNYIMSFCQCTLHRHRRCVPKKWQHWRRNTNQYHPQCTHFQQQWQHQGPCGRWVYFTAFVLVLSRNVKLTLSCLSEIRITYKLKDWLGNRWTCRWLLLDRQKCNYLEKDIYVSAVYCISLIRRCGYYFFSLHIFVRLLLEGGVYFFRKPADSL